MLIFYKSNKKYLSRDKSPESLSNLRNPKNDHKTQTGVFKCDHCEKEFNEKWKMSPHVKKQDKCKCLKYLVIKKKHI